MWASNTPMTNKWEQKHTNIRSNLEISWDHWLTKNPSSSLHQIRSWWDAKRYRSRVWDRRILLSNRYREYNSAPSMMALLSRRKSSSHRSHQTQKTEGSKTYWTVHQMAIQSQRKWWDHIARTSRRSQCRPKISRTISSQILRAPCLQRGCMQPKQTTEVSTALWSNRPARIARWIRERCPWWLIREGMWRAGMDGQRTHLLVQRRDRTEIHISSRNSSRYWWEWSMRWIKMLLALPKEYRSPQRIEEA